MNAVSNSKHYLLLSYTKASIEVPSAFLGYVPEIQF